MSRPPDINSTPNQCVGMVYQQNKNADCANSQLNTTRFYTRLCCTYTHTCTSASFQSSNCTDFIFDMWAPRLRCMPLQSQHTNAPNVMADQSGSWFVTYTEAQMKAKMLKGCLHAYLSYRSLHNDHYHPASLTRVLLFY